MKGDIMTKKMTATADKKKSEAVAPTVEKAIIDKAVQEINELIGNRYYETAIEVGNYVLKNFFKNDIKEVRSKNPNKLLSFNKLCARPDLQVHPKHLNQMVQVAAQERLLIKKLGADKVNKLGYSLKVELLKIHSNKIKIQTAKKWIANPKTIDEAKKDIALLRESNPAASDLIPINSLFVDQLKTISEWTENDELVGKLEGLSINKIKKIKEQIEAFIDKYEPVKNKIDIVKSKIDPIYETKLKFEEAKAAEPPKKRGRKPNQPSEQA